MTSSWISYQWVANSSPCPKDLSILWDSRRHPFNHQEGERKVPPLSNQLETTLCTQSMRMMVNLKKSKTTTATLWLVMTKTRDLSLPFWMIHMRKSSPTCFKRGMKWILESHIRALTLNRFLSCRLITKVRGTWITLAKDRVSIQPRKWVTSMISIVTEIRLQADKAAWCRHSQWFLITIINQL